MNQRGQAVTETILILMVFIVVATLIASAFKQNELFSQMISSPWQRTAGMLQNGVWAPPATGAALHPSQHERHISIEGERNLR